MKNILLSVCLAFPMFLWGQDRSNMYPYLLTPGYVNPAVQGSNTYTDLQFVSRTAFGKTDGLPRTFGAFVSFPMGDRSAVGGKVMTDFRGAQRIFNAEASYAKGVRLAENHYFYLGLSAGTTQFGLDRQAINSYTELPDDIINSNIDNRLRFSAGAGLYYQWGKGLEVGVSAPALVTSGYPVTQDIYGMAAYSLYLRGDSLIKIKPIVWYHRLPTQADVADFLLQVGYKDMVWLQGGYRTTQSYSVGAGAYFKWFGFAYTAHLNESIYGTAVRGLHEVQLRFRFGYDMPKI